MELKATTLCNLEAEFFPKSKRIDVQKSSEDSQKIKN